jgi:hypothetical protein
MVRWLAWPALALLVLLACSGAGCSNTDHTINLADYNTACAADSDCWPIDVGDVCGACCPTGAINVSDYSRYSSDLSARREGCPRIYPDCFCPEVAACVAGHCALVMQRADAGAD